MFAAACWSLVLVTNAVAMNYAYDSRGRLTSVIYDNNISVAYTYDAAGNLLSVVNGTAVTKPDNFTFPPKTGVAKSILIESAPVTIAGINTQSPITSSNGEYCI